MKIRYSADPIRFESMNTNSIRENFLAENLFVKNELKLIYSDQDRVIFGSACPVENPLELSAFPELRCDYFCQRRELGILNIGGAGVVTVDGKKYEMATGDGLYVGMGSQAIQLNSVDKNSHAEFYLISYPAHKQYPTSHAKKIDAQALELGTIEQSNKRTIYKYIYPGGIESCQLVMGFTELAPGCVWNTMPAHTHERRMEVYLYYNMNSTDRVFHLMGKPSETRHVVVADRQAIISPSWSIHSGVGTGAYTFCWGMGGENQDFSDMDGIEISDLK